MGFWSTSLYGNDLTLDVRDKLDDLLKSGVSSQDVYQEMLKCFEEVLSTDEESLFWFALADRMWDYGILTDEIKEKALTYMTNIAEHEYLDELETARERRSWQNTLNKLKTKIENVNQGNKKIKVEPVFKRNIWNVGDYYAYEFHKKNSQELGIQSKYIVIKKIKDNYYGDTMFYYNIVYIYNKIFDEIPTLKDLENVNYLPLSGKAEEDLFRKEPDEELRKIMAEAVNERVLDPLLGDLQNDKISDDFKMRIKFITENIRECKYCNLYYFKINDYKSKYFHFIGNDTTNLPKPLRNINQFLDFRDFEKDLCIFLKDWNSDLINKK